MREARADKTTKMAGRTILLLATTLTALVVASGVALAATVTCQADAECLGTRNADTLLGSGGSDFAYGRAGADTLKGLDGDDDLYGQGGVDRLLGGPGGDELTGGPGNDILRGGTGPDMYAFGPGWGKDALVDTDGNYHLLSFRPDFGPSPASEDLEIDLIPGEGPEVTNESATDTIEWEGYVIRDVIGGEGDDEISGNYMGNQIYGEGGHDTIRGYSGNDVIHANDGSGGDIVDCGETLYGVDDDTVYYEEGDTVSNNCENKLQVKAP